MLNYIQMKGKNRYIKNAHISKKKFKKIKVFLFGFDSKTNIKDDKPKS